MPKNRLFLRKRSSRTPFLKLNNPTSTTLQKNKNKYPSNRLPIPLPPLTSPFPHSTDQHYTNLDLHTKNTKIIIPLPSNTMQVSRAPKKSSILKNNNNISISNSIQSQTSILPVERLRDQNIALKTNNSQKTNQTFPNVPNSIPPNQTVERN